MAESAETRYPEIEVQLSGSDGNAFMMIGKVSRELRRAGVDDDTIKQFQTEATSGDYEHVFATINRWVDVS